MGNTAAMAHPCLVTKELLEQVGAAEGAIFSISVGGYPLHGFESSPSISLTTKALLSTLAREHTRCRLTFSVSKTSAQGA